MPPFNTNRPPGGPRGDASGDNDDPIADALRNPLEFIAREEEKMKLPVMCSLVRAVERTNPGYLRTIPVDETHETGFNGNIFISPLLPNTIPRSGVNTLTPDAARRLTETEFDEFYRTEYHFNFVHPEGIYYVRAEKQYLLAQPGENPFEAMFGHIHRVVEEGFGEDDFGERERTHYQEGEPVEIRRLSRYPLQLKLVLDPIDGQESFRRALEELFIEIRQRDYSDCPSELRVPIDSLEVDEVTAASIVPEELALIDEFFGNTP